MAAQLVSGLEYMHAQSVIRPSGIISHPSLGIFSFTRFPFIFQVRFMAAQLVSGLEYMHAQSAIHPSDIIPHPSPPVSFPR